MMFCKKHNKVLLIALFVIWGCLVFGTGFALAQQDESSNAINLGVTYGQQTGLGGDDIRLVIARVIRVALGLLGIIALVIVLYGGYVYMTAAGNEEKVSQAKKIMINGVIGLVIILSSLAIVQFIFNKLQEATMGREGETSENCVDKTKECFPDWCDANPVECCYSEIETNGLLVAKSITPVTQDTGMNNVAIRAIFSQGLSDKFTSGQVFTVKGGNNDVSDLFTYRFFVNNKGQRVGVEAVYKNDANKCDAETPCLDYGKYEVSVNVNLESVDGKIIQTETDCGAVFPLKANFTIKGNEQDKILQFNGDDASRVAFTDKNVGKFNDKFSASVWFNAPEPTKSARRVFTRQFGGVNNGGGYMLYLSGDLIVFNLITDNGNTQPFYKLPSFNRWYHAVTVYDGQSAILYIDGKQVAKKSLTGAIKEVAAIPFTVGNDSSAAKNYGWNGKIDDVRLYNRVLSPDEIMLMAKKKYRPYSKDGLFVDLTFDNDSQPAVKDSSALNQKAVSSGNLVWVAVNGAEFKIKDTEAPQASSLLINNSLEKDQPLKPGKIFPIASNITDNSGAGYAHLQIEKEDGSKFFDTFEGTAVVRGSDAPFSNPYGFKYFIVSANQETQAVKYNVILDALDIDQNKTTVQSSFIILPQHCNDGIQNEGETDIDIGGSCGEGREGENCEANWQCDSGKCVEGKCIAQPKILDIYQLNGAAGNYVTIVGKYFGSEKGTVQFGYDNKWVDAKVVDCQKKTSWYNTWIIVEVPADVDLPLGSKSAIKVERGDSTKDNPLLDYSNDDFGPKIDLFEKNIIKRPGLCAVSVADGQAVPAGAVAAPPKTAVVAAGSGLGNGAKSKIRFGEIQAPYTSWSDALINSKVPENMKAGVSVVYVDVDNISSNGVPFTVLASGDVAKDIPVIDAIDPPTTTPSSFITIYGHGFGNTKGAIYLASSAEAAIECAKKDGVGACDALNLILPDSCGWTWTDTQIVAQVSESSPAKKYFLILKNALGFYSDGNNPFEIKSGDPYPGLCKLEPNAGPAPLPDGEFLELNGANFSDQSFEDAIYFWRNGADANKMKTWLKTSDNEVNDADNGFIRAVMPVSDGLSMQTGPVKVGVTKNNQELFSNSLKYTVYDCRKADDKLKYLMDDAGFQCCAKDGPDVGRWKSGGLACAGEPRLAGYVWRFTTGKIHQLPKVVEECNEVDWDTPGKAINYPSPVPSVLWTKGKETCLNATIAVRFTVPMDESILKEQDKDGKFVNVKVFECSKGEKPDCDKEKLEVPTGELYMAMAGPSILEIRKVVPPKTNLKPNQWYHIELSDKIVSADCGLVGVAKCYQDNLQKTKPCGAGTAYCFDFKTGNEDNLCHIKNASIAPTSYIAHLLGLVLNPAYPFDSKIEHPYFYFVWGRGDQECVVLNVDGLGWKWGTKDDNVKASADVAPTAKGETPPYTDSRAKVWANENAPEGVEIQAKADAVILKETSDVLKAIGSQTTNADGIVKLDKLKNSDFVNSESYSIYLDFELNDAPTSSPWFTATNDENGAVKYWLMERVLYYNPKVAVIRVIETVNFDGSKERWFDFHVNPFAKSNTYYLSHIKKFDSSNVEAWPKASYIIKKDGEKLSLFANDLFTKIDSVDCPTGNNQTSASIAVGGSYSGDALISPFVGKFTKFIIEKQIGSGNGITATSTLFIDLYAPQVVKWWPNCVAACVNTGIGVKFNRPMFQSDYAGAIKIEKCIDGETCAKKEQIGWAYDSGTSDEYILRVLPNNTTDFLASSTWYVVTINKDVHALYTLNPGDSIDKKNAKSMTEDFVWKFRTKDDDTPCVVSTVSVLPNPFMATIVGQKTKYTAAPISSPDACSPDGQELNPWLYGWQWASSIEKVAEITNFSAVQKGSTFCGLDCKKLGSDISSKDTTPFLCGNNVVEPGEDCDIAGSLISYDANNPNGIPKSEVPGESCTFNCLRPGNLKQAVTSTLGYCGNGIAEPEFGEECDVEDKESGKYCDKDCLWAGSSTVKGAGEHDPLCGSGAKTVGEDCDTAVISTTSPDSQIGCSSKCLHLGTQLARFWCDNNDEDFPIECQKAISVCGNGKIESGEECDSKTDKACSDKCLLKNLCGVEGIADGLKCDPKSAGCKKDCTLAGSSIFYSVPSLCGDGVVGIGEYKGCEEGVSVNKLGANPFQFATAIGKGDVNPLTKTQQTDVSAKTTTYLKAEKPVALLGDQMKTGIGKYDLKCGNTEYKVPDSAQDDIEYNDCELAGDYTNTSLGVADNSCCYERAYRTDEYPASDAMGVCRNTFISVSFTNHSIDEKSLPSNLTVAIGHEKTDNFKCGQNEEDVSADIYNASASNNVAVNNTGGFWHGLWSKIKGVFVRLFVNEVNADHVNPADRIWCAGSVKAVPELHYQLSKDLSTVTTTVALYIDTLLSENAAVAIFLRGGIDGVKDGQGIGVRSPDSDKQLLNDVWFFDTGADICKLKSISVKPDRGLFDKPLASSTFFAITETTNGQQIQSIFGQYAWKWDWQPQENPIFDIPAEGSDSSKDAIYIAARSVEGSQVAVANAKVTEDVDKNNNSQVGEVFTGMTSLQAMFCEHPWPSRQYFPFEEGISFGKTVNASGFDEGGDFNGAPLPKVGDDYFNFQMNYCADAGKSDDQSDDLPYLKSKLFFNSEDKSLSEDTLKRFIFFSDINDDAIGVQIFKNIRRLTASQWLQEKFGAVSGMKTAKIGGYDAVTDGSNYYINALNEAGDKNIYNNIYQFSINKNAQQNTQNVFKQMLKSLKFNINISDFGYCLLENANNPASHGKIPCTTDFDCRDSVGVEKDGTNGECSNKKTELFRDWARLPEYKTMQQHFQTYYTQNDDKYPDLKSGTYIPGYTVSMWSSWGKLGGTVNGLPTDKINKWVGCPNGKADQQTCWNAASSTFSCPQFASVYEYEFVSSTNGYLFHGPLEYFALDSAVAKDFIDSKYFTTERGCTPLAVYSPFGEKCGDGVVNANEECDPPGKTATSEKDGDGAVCAYGLEQAIKTCNQSCKWDYSDCESTTVCGNGKVEGIEVCDDGTLNGTYGHCKAKTLTEPGCDGKFVDYCGNKKIDTRNGKPLEKCDINQPEILKNGYCSKQQTHQCQSAGDCVYLASVVDKMKFGGISIKQKCVHEPNNAMGDVYVCGSCESVGDSSYDFFQQYSCAWDCQNYGEYCGDGKIKVGLEECDDQNKDNLDSCDTECGAVNVDCRQRVSFATTTDSTAVNVVEDSIPVTECIDTHKHKPQFDDTGNEVCHSFGLYCQKVQKLSITQLIPNGAWVDVGCSADLSDASGQYPDVHVICDGVYKGAPVAPVAPIESHLETCGNGTQETYKDGTKEACDLGDKNGVKCDPTYGKACTYCSIDCKNVLTVDPEFYCGNGSIDPVVFSKASIVYEECEKDKNGDVITHVKGQVEPKIMKCDDKGSFKCENCKLSNNCVACGVKAIDDGAAVPKIAILNPMIADGHAWPTTPEMGEEYVALYRVKDWAKFPNPYLGYTKVSYNVADPTELHSLFMNDVYAPNMTTGTESNVLCNGEYGLFFNNREIFNEKTGEFTNPWGRQNFDNDWEIIKNYGDIFAYPVNGEKKEVKNEVIMSPAVSDGAFRVVLRWTKEDARGDFGGIVYNQEFIINNNSGQVVFADVETAKGTCGEMELGKFDLWIPPASCAAWPKNFSEIFVHPVVHGENVFIQSMTIDTGLSVLQNKKKPFAYFVDAIDEPIYNYLDSNLQVEVYAYHEGQMPQWSVYGPVATYSISAAETSSNVSAEYWHVFNLEYKDGKYQIVPVNKIATDFCEMQQNIPEESCNKTQ